MTFTQHIVNLSNHCYVITSDFSQMNFIIHDVCDFNMGVVKIDLNFFFLKKLCVAHRYRSQLFTFSPYVLFTLLQVWLRFLEETSRCAVFSQMKLRLQSYMYLGVSPVDLSWSFF